MYTIRQQLFKLHFKLLFLMFSINASAQSPVYKNYTVNDGLPSQVVYCALQDQQGYMWFGTDAGVSRFDGKHFVNFTSRDGLSDNEVLNMFLDSKGRIWFYTLNRKISYFLDDRFHNPSNDSLLSKINLKYELMSFLEDSYGNVWLGGYGRQLILITNNGEVETFDFDSQDIGFRRAWIYPYEKAPNEIWFFTPNQIWQYKNGNMSVRDSSNFLNPFKTRFNLFRLSSA
ncbi:MAG: two-component regulator propeller domain-containing protein, partial [Chitinophagales bacterium]